MPAQDECLSQDPFVSAPNQPSSSTRTVPIIRAAPPPSIPGDPMEVVRNAPPQSAGSAPMGPPARTSPDSEANGHDNNTAMALDQASGGPAAPNAAAAAMAGSQQPKVVQTAFIHKLYNMLEDPSIQHLISWSASAESFVMSPSSDFSKVLAQYFKHTNISSFVRQLNMYGFHKVSDVFHTGSPESSLWEFKHGNGNFKRGNLLGLREIKRRASRHSLVHRDSYPTSKTSVSQPGTPAEPIQPTESSTETRLAHLEHTLYEMHARLARSEENTQFLHVRNSVLMESLGRSLQINQEVARAVLSLAPNQDNPIHRDIMHMQGEIQRQAEIIRSMEDPQETPFSGSRAYFSNVDNAPVSPRQMAQDDPRRPPPGVPQPRQNFYRPPVPSQLSIAPRGRYGSIGSTTASSPNRPQGPPPPPPPQHLAPTIQSPPNSLSRRHTTADIRAHGWQPSPSPYASGHNSSQWPSSPKRPALNLHDDQRLRDSLSAYSINGPSQSRPATPPLTNGSSVDSLGAWSWGTGRDRLGSTSLFKDSSGPPTRRGSMAHILNPAETAERDEELDEEMVEAERKRKRLQ